MARLGQSWHRFGCDMAGIWVRSSFCFGWPRWLRGLAGHGDQRYRASAHPPTHQSTSFQAPGPRLAGSARGICTAADARSDAAAKQACFREPLAPRANLSWSYGRAPRRQSPGQSGQRGARATTKARHTRSARSWSFRSFWPFSGPFGLVRRPCNIIRHSLALALPHQRRPLPQPKVSCSGNKHQPRDGYGRDWHQARTQLRPDRTQDRRTQDPLKRIHGIEHPIHLPRSCLAPLRRMAPRYQLPPKYQAPPKRASGAGTNQPKADKASINQRLNIESPALQGDISDTLTAISLLRCKNTTRA